MDGIENFDSITYRIPTMNALKFWESIGAQASGFTILREIFLR